jgi:antitoxin PrlF
MRRSAQPEWARDTRRVMATRVKRETLGNDETEPGRSTRRFTLHDASLRGHMHAAAHNVKVRLDPVRNNPYLYILMYITERSTLTAKGQTTVPKAVRQALDIRPGDRIAFRVDQAGKVSLTRDEAPDEDSAVDAFLAFLSDDIKQRPEAVSALSEETAARMRALSAGVDVDLDSDFEGGAGL